MDKKTIISQIKELLFQKEEQINNKNMEFMDLVLLDGTPIHIVTQVEGSISAGDEIYVMNEDGSAMPAPVGEHVLEDGTTLVVETEGLIASIIEVEEEVPAADAPAADAPAAEEMSQELFMDITLKDGPIVHIITQVEGSYGSGDKIMIDGVEAAPGEYTTNDSKVIIVAENGVISEVKEVSSVEETPVAEVPVEEAPVAESNVLETLIRELTQKVESLEGAFNSMKEENETLKNEVAKFSKAPSAEPTKTTIDFKKVSKEDKLRFFSK